MFSRSFSEPTSAEIESTPLPNASSSFAVDSSGPLPRATNVTSAPWAAKCSAAARPIPFEPAGHDGDLAFERSIDLGHPVLLCEMRATSYGPRSRVCNRARVRLFVKSSSNRRGRVWALAAALLLTACGGGSPRAPDPATSEGEPRPSELLTLADQALDRGDLSEAQKRYARVLRTRPDSARALAGLGGVELARGNLGAARAHFEAALRADPEALRALMGLGLVFAREGNRAEARAHFEQVVRAGPDERRCARGARRTHGMGGQRRDSQGSRGRSRFDGATPLRPAFAARGQRSAGVPRRHRAGPRHARADRLASPTWTGPRAACAPDPRPARPRVARAHDRAGST